MVMNLNKSYYRRNFSTGRNSTCQSVDIMCLAENVWT